MPVLGQDLRKIELKTDSAILLCMDGSVYVTGFVAVAVEEDLH